MSSDEIEEKREYAKIELQQFVDNLSSESYINSVTELISNLNTQLSKEINDYYDFQSNRSEVFSLDTNYLEDKLFALTEMNVVYVYKEFEINLKRLIGFTFKIDTKDFFKWEAVKAFLKTKNIDVTKLKGFQEVNQLREVNNSIKHSGKIDNKLNEIKEFKNQEYLNYTNLYKFYKRVNKHIYVFLQSLSDSIFDNLYVFTDQRLEKIAELYAERLDKETAEKFIKILRKHY